MLNARRKGYKLIICKIDIQTNDYKNKRKYFVTYSLKDNKIACIQIFSKYDKLRCHNMMLNC